jgi:hypothetical protein
VQLVPAIRFRFTVEGDVAAYGDGWWVYDEQALTSLPGQDLIALEEALGMPLTVVMDKFRERSALGVMAAMWIAVHRGGHTVAWADFNPLVFLADLEEVPAAPLGEGSGESPPTGSPSSEPPTEESATSS